MLQFLVSYWHIYTDIDICDKPVPWIHASQQSSQYILVVHLAKFSFPGNTMSGIQCHPILRGFLIKIFNALCLCVGVYCWPTRWSVNQSNWAWVHPQTSSSRQFSRSSWVISLHNLDSLKNYIYMNCTFRRPAANTNCMHSLSIRNIRVFDHWSWPKSATGLYQVSICISQGWPHLLLLGPSFEEMCLQ